MNKRNIAKPFIYVATLIATAFALNEAHAQTETHIVAAYSEQSIKTIGHLPLSSIRGSTIVNEEGETLGRIKDLLVNTRSGSAPLALVTTDDWFDGNVVAVPTESLEVGQGESAFVVKNAVAFEQSEALDYSVSSSNFMKSNSDKLNEYFGSNIDFDKRAMYQKISDLEDVRLTDRSNLRATVQSITVDIKDSPWNISYSISSPHLDEAMDIELSDVEWSSKGDAVLGTHFIPFWERISGEVTSIFESESKAETKIQENEVLLSELIGAKIINKRGERLGSVNELLIDESSGTPIVALLSTDNWFDGTVVAVPFSKLDLEFDRKKNRYVENVRFTMDIDESRFDSLTEYASNDLDFNTFLYTNIQSINKDFGTELILKSDHQYLSSSSLKKSEIKDSNGRSIGTDNCVVDLDDRNRISYVINPNGNEENTNRLSVSKIDWGTTGTGTANLTLSVNSDRIEKIPASTAK